MSDEKKIDNKPSSYVSSSSSESLLRSLLAQPRISRRNQRQMDELRRNQSSSSNDGDSGKPSGTTTDEEVLVNNVQNLHESESNERLHLIPDSAIVVPVEEKHRVNSLATYASLERRTNVALPRISSLLKEPIGYGLACCHLHPLWNRFNPDYRYRDELQKAKAFYKIQTRLELKSLFQRHRHSDDSDSSSTSSSSSLSNA